MLPTLFEIPKFSLFGLKLGGWPIHTFGLVMVLAFFGGLWLARKRATARGMDANRLSDLFFWTLIFGVLGARVLFIVQEWDHYSKNTNEIFSLQFSGLTSFGGLLFGLAAVIVWCFRTKTPLVKVLDVVGPAMLLGHGIGRIGCLLNGCCGGGACPADLPWGIHDSHGLLIHPAQAYDSLMTFAALGAVLAIERWGTFRGQAFALSIALYGLSRFVYEFWRAGVTSTYMPGLPITEAQFVALLMTVSGLVMYVLFLRRDRVRERLRPIKADEVPAA